MKTEVAYVRSFRDRGRAFQWLFLPLANYPWNIRRANRASGPQLKAEGHASMRAKRTPVALREIGGIHDVAGCADDYGISGCIGGDWFVRCKNPSCAGFCEPDGSKCPCKCHGDGGAD